MQYNFITEWKFKASIDEVWNEIRDMDAWPQWWKFVKSVKLIRKGDINDIGSIRRIEWSTALPYSICFKSELTAIEYHKRMEGKAYGDLTGTGIWTFKVDGDITYVTYVWRVVTTQWWMNFLAPFARPLFKWNHDQVMKAGKLGLTIRLDN